ncbi:MAG: hypothetical protein ACK4J0_01225 [Candidatus Anstonellaceae archaeon]
MKKGQSASEYLATYGWALIIVFIIIVYLVNSGIFLPSRFTSEECNFQPDLPCSRFYTTTSGNSLNLAFELTNGMGFPIMIKSCSAQLLEGGSGRKSGKDCVDRYLEQGESTFLIINDIPAYKELQPRTVERILTEIQFVSCKGLDFNNCKNQQQTLYITQGKITSQVLEGGQFYSANFGDCIGGAKRCSGSIVQSCQWDVTKNKYTWKDEKICILPEICQEIGNSPFTDAYCSNPNAPKTGGICGVGVKRCNGNILEICYNGYDWKKEEDCALLGGTCKVKNNQAYCDLSSQSPSIPSLPTPPSPPILVDYDCKSNEIGYTKCFSNEPTAIYRCVLDQNTGKYKYIQERQCLTQCEQRTATYAECAQCKENEKKCAEPNFPPFTLLECKKNSNNGLLEWQPKSCSSGEKCFTNTNQCSPDNRPLCDPGFRCAEPDSQEDQNTVYQCQNGQWQEFQTCSDTGCYKGECRVRGSGEFDECNLDGIKRCTEDYLTLQECIGGQWVNIQNCVGDTYCSVFSQDDAGCVNR